MMRKAVSLYSFAFREIPFCLMDPVKADWSTVQCAELDPRYVTAKMGPKYIEAVRKKVWKFLRRVILLR